MKKIIMEFLPIALVFLGSGLLLISGVNQFVGDNIFEAMKYVEWYGWSGLVIALIGVGWSLLRER